MAHGSIPHIINSRYRRFKIKRGICVMKPKEGRIKELLRERGLDIEGECLSMDDAADRIAEVLKA